VNKNNIKTFSVVYYKKQVNFFEKVSKFFLLKIKNSFFCHKMFILLELQLNSLLMRSKLVPYFFLISELCFYRLIYVNGSLIKTPYFITSLFDSIKIPLFFYKQLTFYNFPSLFSSKILKKYYYFFFKNFYNKQSRKLWFLSNYIYSPISGEILLFDYPNILLFLSPFRRFSKIYFRNQPF
jgi:hypothetical protein